MAKFYMRQLVRWSPTNCLAKIENIEICQCSMCRNTNPVTIYTIKIDDRLYHVDHGLTPASKEEENDNAVPWEHICG